ncbi:MAG: UDP-N-acetylglucosamine 2-epimerase (non-hydrolyzing) [Methylobacterium mesophilicum]|nr:UDP-N-acetylglucosamine 2-epimerase (non-hydrolyzing) [Methylobacterium mesophilicum]
MTAGPLVDLVMGARPNFVKVAALVRAFEAHREAGGRLRFRLVNTGQHSDPLMSRIFLDQLGLPEPDVDFRIGHGSQAEQTGAMMVAYERLLRRAPPNLTLVVGDVTSTLACALTASRCGVPVAHVEAGLRSGDRAMPEEINRIATDAIADWFFTTSEQAGRNLLREGVPPARTVFVGNTMIDTLRASLDRARKPDFWDASSLQGNAYGLLTLHRPSNVDHRARLAGWLEAVASAAHGLPVVFPVHPRTAKLVEGFALPPNLCPVPPQPYLEFLFLLRHARVVVTDSGGIQEEATVLGVPCMTLRATTERPETVELGTNEVLGTDPAALCPAFERLRAGWKRGGIPPLWDGRAGPRIVAALDSILCEHR